MIDLTINKEQLERAIQRAREKKILIPTFRQMKNPHLIPEAIKKKLKAINLLSISSMSVPASRQQTHSHEPSFLTDP